MRILHVIMTGGLFGSERYCVDLAARQAALGHDLHIAISPRSKIPALAPAGVTLHRVGWWFRRRRLAALARRLRADIVHCHLSAACKAFSAAANHPPAVATLHTGYKPRQHDGLNGLIALTDSDVARITAFRGPVARIRNWAPAMADPGPGARQAVRESLGISADAFLVGFIGRLHPAKDPQTLIRAFLAASLPGAHLAMAGEGPERPELERLIAGRSDIHLLGYRRDAPALYRAFDLFVLPSRDEWVPLASLEAMTAGLPMAISDIPHLLEFVPVPPASVFPLGDSGALAAILHAEAGRGQRRQAWDLTPFDSDRQVATIMDFYNTVRAA